MTGAEAELDAEEGRLSLHQVSVAGGEGRRVPLSETKGSHGRALLRIKDHLQAHHHVQDQMPGLQHGGASEKCLPPSARGSGLPTSVRPPFPGPLPRRNNLSR